MQKKQGSTRSGPYGVFRGTFPKCLGVQNRSLLPCRTNKEPRPGPTIPPALASKARHPEYYGRRLRQKKDKLPVSKEGLALSPATNMVPSSNAQFVAPEAGLASRISSGGGRTGQSPYPQTEGRTSQPCSWRRRMVGRSHHSCSAKRTGQPAAPLARKEGQTACAPSIGRGTGPEACSTSGA